MGVRARTQVRFGFGFGVGGRLGVGLDPMRPTQPPAAWPTTRSPHEEVEDVEALRTRMGGIGSLGEAPQLLALLRLPRVRVGVGGLGLGLGLG